MIDLLSLGELYVSDFLAPDEEPRCPPAELRLQMDETTGAVRLKDVVDPSFMYGRYWYRSGINESMKDDLEDIVRSVKKIKQVKVTDVWLDIACNDGTLLSYVPKYFPGAYGIGIDPVQGDILGSAYPGAEYINDFFTKDAWDRSGASHHGHAAVVTCAAMFYDLDDPAPFLKDVHDVLRDDGVLILQMSYTPLMIDQLAFDNICHEHVYYYSLQTITNVLGRSGFKVMDCQLNDTNGGSFRVYAMKRGADESTFGSQPYRDVCNWRIEMTNDAEMNGQYNNQYAWSIFRGRLAELKQQVNSTITGIIKGGGTVGAYGASTKGNTLLQYFGLDSTKICYAVERSPAKFGLRTIGTNIPIISEEEMREHPPTAMLILPWCFQGEFIKREAAYLRNGGMFIIPCPEFRIVTADDL